MENHIHTVDYYPFIKSQLAQRKSTSGPFGFRIPGSRFRVLRVSVFGFRFSGPSFRVQGSGFGVQGSKVRIRCRANMTNTRRSRPDSGLDFQVKSFESFKLFPFRSNAEGPRLPGQRYVATYGHG